MARPLYAIQQTITAGSNFNGVAPGTSPTDTNGLRVYPTDTDGGEFDFYTERGFSQPVAVQQVLLKLGGQSAWSINVVDVATAITATIDRTLEFKDNGGSPDTIEASSGSFVEDGYRPGMTITVAGTTSNNGSYVVDSVTDLVITLAATEILANEGPLDATAALSAETDPVVVDSGGAGTDHYLNNATPILLLPGQHLRILTTGASAAMWAWVIFTPSPIGGF